MSVMIQIRNVPNALHRTLKARAALHGKSLSDLILDELRAMAALPSTEELRQRLKTVDAFSMQHSSAALIRRNRAER